MRFKIDKYILGAAFLFGASIALLIILVLSQNYLKNREGLLASDSLGGSKVINLIGDNFINVEKKGDTNYAIKYDPSCDVDNGVLKWDLDNERWECVPDSDKQQLSFDTENSILDLTNSASVDLSSLVSSATIEAGNGLYKSIVGTSNLIYVNSPICSSGEVLSWDGSKFVCVVDQTSTVIIGATADAEYLTLSGDSGLTNERSLVIGSGLVSLDGGSNGSFTISRVGGNNIGDLEYWNGSNWQILPIGSDGESLSISGGIPVWTNLSGNFINNQNTVAQNANFWINGTAQIDSALTLPFLSVNRLVATDSNNNLVDNISESNLESSITGVTNVFTDNDLIPSSNIADSYLLNTGDTATGDYNFSSGTLFIDSVNGRVGVGDITPDATLDVAGTVRIDGGIMDSSGDIGLSGQILTSTGSGIDWVDASSIVLGSINQHTDVDTTTNLPNSGDVLKWNGSNWVPGNDNDTTYSAGVGLALTGTTFSLNAGINDLTDVDTVTNLPLNNQLLGWDGVNWIPMSLSSLETITNISNQVAGHKIADYTNEAGVIQSVYETVTSLSLNTNSLDYLDENGNTTNIDLSGYLDNTDDQVVDTFNIQSDILHLSLENDGQADYTVDLSGYLDNTDSQTLSFSSGTNILSLTNGGSVDLTSLNDEYTAGSGLAMTSNVFSLNAGIDLLTDVDTTTNLPNSGDVLKWNGSNWVPGNDNDTTYSAGVGLALTGTTFSLNAGINDLTDVDTVTNLPNSGDFLQWNGTNWIPVASSGYGVNIYNSDGVLTGLRTLNLNGNDLLFDGSGNIGIGTTSPSTKLQVVGQVRSSSFSTADGTEVLPSYRFNNDSDTGLFLAGTNEIGFTTGGNRRLLVTSNSLELNPYGTNTGETLDIRFFELTPNGSNYVGFKAPDSIISNIVWTLPNTDGINNQVLKTDGSGNLGWVDASTLGYWAKSGTNLSPAVSGDDVLLNTGESLTISDLSQGSILFAGAGGIISQNNANLYWDNANNRLGLGTNTPAYTLDVNGSGQFNGSIIVGGLTLNDAYIRDSAQINLQASGDMDDYVYFDTTGNIPGMFFASSSLGYVNDPGLRLNSATGEIEYRDEDESAWTSLDSLSSGSSGTGPLAIAMGTMSRGNSWAHHSTYTFDLSDVYDPDNIIDDVGEQIVIPSGASYMVVYLTAQTSIHPDKGFRLCYTLTSDTCNYAIATSPGVYVVSASGNVGASLSQVLEIAHMSGITIPVTPGNTWWFRVNSWMSSTTNSNYYYVRGWFKIEFY